MRWRVDRADRRSRAAEVIVLVLVGPLLSLGVIIETTFFHADHVTTTSATRDLHYGFPLAWVSQDQSTFTPKPGLPTSARFASPWHNPTSTSEARLLEDFAILSIAPISLYAVTAGAILLVRRRRSARSTKPRLTLVA